MRYVKHPKKIFWGSFSFSGTGAIERKVITDMKSTFPESEGDFQKTQIICVSLA